MPVELSRSQGVRLAGIFLGIALGLSALFHWQPGPTAGLASAVSDTYYRFNPHAPSADVVFLKVDHDAVKRLGRWPWSRDALAEGVAKLDKTAAVALDMVFSEPTTPAQDQALGAAFGKATTVGGIFINGVLPSQPDEATMNLLANSALTDIHDIVLGGSDAVELSVPDVLSGLTTLASLNTLPDADERFRHYPAGFRLFKMVQPSLGVQTLQIVLNTPASLQGGTDPTLGFGTRKIQLDRDGYTRLNFYPVARFKAMSMARLYEPGFDPATLTGKIVVLGVTEAGVTDIRATPLGQYPGALLHATFLANALGGHTLSELRTPTMGTVIVIVLAITLLVMLLRQLWLRLLAYGLLIAGSYGAGALLYLYAGFWLESAFLIVGILLTAMLVETSLLSHSKLHTEKLRTAFSTYLPPSLVNRIVDDPDKLKLGGEKKVITVLFSDIRGFTSMSESIEADQLATILGLYFQPMTEAIFKQGGTLDKYIGDAIMALFNAPLDQPDHALAACRAAIAMQYAQLRINEVLQKQGLAEQLRTGIGVNTGQAVVGNLGSSIRFNYTAVGDSVNLASRLESSTKKVGADIVIGESTHALVKDALPCRALGEISVAGKERPQTIYELCWKDVPDPATGERHKAPATAVAG
jgi:adenylate cyclase